MDAWSEEQLKKMEMSGNNKMNTFLQQYGIEKSCPIVKKYNSPAAEVCAVKQRRLEMMRLMCLLVLAVPRENDCRG